MKMLLDKIDYYIKEVNLHDKVWKGITAPDIDIEDFILLNEEDRQDIFDTLDDKTKEKILKLQEGGLL